MKSIIVFPTFIALSINNKNKLDLTETLHFYLTLFY